MTNAELEADLALAARAISAAGEAVMRAFRTDLAVRYKSPEQPVTDADLAADGILREMLLEERPGYGWLSEETKDSPERRGRARLWVVDPIDGTNSFVEGIAEFALCVALVEHGEAVLGLILNPATDELYHAAAGGGAFLNGAPIRVAATAGDAEVRTVLASRWEMGRGELEHFRDRWALSPLGSTAYKMAKVAEGAGDVFVSAGGKSEWDVCAGDVIVREAGGRVTDIRGEPYVYNRPEPTVRGVIATNGLLHPAALDAALSR